MLEILRMQKLKSRYNLDYNKKKSINNFIKQNVNRENIIPEGAKVKLNYKNITSHPDYNKKTKDYRDFVENNKGKIFTVQYDKHYGNYGNGSMLVALKEDLSEMKWLFHCEYDLIVIDK